MKRYAVLHAPDFRLQAVLRHQSQLRLKPVALLEVRDRKSRIVEMNGPAGLGQVEVGMTPTQATARCEGIQLLVANPGYERSAQEILLQAAERLSPFLETTGPGIVTVIWPPEKIFQEEDLQERLIEPLRKLGLHVRIGVAETPDLALIAARQDRPLCWVDEVESFLKPLPISVLAPSGEIRNVLHAWGIHTVGQLLALPARDTCERLGPEAVRLWEEARGGRPRPLKLIKPQEFFSEQADLEHALEMLEPLLFVLRRFLEQIALRLTSAHLVAGRLRLMLRFENGSPYHRVFTVPQPTGNADILFRMLHTHLENFTSKSPIIGVALAAKPVRPGAEQFSLLEKGVRDPHQLAETLARLEGLLGVDRVGTPELEASHHPDAFHLRSYDAAAFSSLVLDEPSQGIPWLKFRPPVPALVTLIEGRPGFLSSACATGTIQEARGPWVLEGNWWEERRWSREEWDIAADETMYRLVRWESGWFLDGIYI